MLMDLRPETGDRHPQPPELFAKIIDYAGGISELRPGSTAFSEGAILVGVICRQKRHASNVPGRGRELAHHAMRDPIALGIQLECLVRNIVERRLQGLPSFRV